MKAKPLKPLQLKRVAPSYAYEAQIRWSRPVPYDKIITDGSPHAAEGWLYMILGYHRSSHPKLFYIGKVVQTDVPRRLRQPDHRARYERLSKDHPRHTFRVSLGAVRVLNGNITPVRIDHIETLLIFAICNSQPHMINQRKYYVVRVPNPYIIRNLRYRKPLPREIHFGVFAR